MDALVRNGDVEHAQRRRALADRSRINAQSGATAIAAVVRRLDHRIASSTRSLDDPDALCRVHRRPEG
jgi:hypothetical protein